MANAPREYDIINNISYNTPSTKTPSRVRYQNSVDYNILSNHYYYDDDAKTNREIKKQKAEYEARRKPTEFNLITGEYSNSGIERKSRTIEKIVRDKKKEIHDAHIPISYKIDVTQGYDLINHQVKNKNLLQTLDRLESLKKSKWSQKNFIQDELHARELLNYTRAQNVLEERRKNQTHYLCHPNLISHEFDGI